MASSQSIDQSRDHSMLWEICRREGVSFGLLRWGLSRLECKMKILNFDPMCIPPCCLQLLRIFALPQIIKLLRKTYLCLIGWKCCQWKNFLWACLFRSVYSSLGVIITRKFMYCCHCLRTRLSYVCVESFPVHEFPPFVSKFQKNQSVPQRMCTQRPIYDFLMNRGASSLH